MPFLATFLSKDINELRENNIFAKLNDDDENELIYYWINKVKSRFNSYSEFKDSVNKKKEKSAKRKEQL